jgi:hypothetical protein
LAAIKHKQLLPRHLGGEGDGILQCGTSSLDYNSQIFFQADKDKNFKSGSWSIKTFSGAEIKSGSINSGGWGKTSFSISGVVNQDPGCNAPVPVTMTISGQCGTGVTINFKAADGETGTFTGNVACS